VAAAEEAVEVLEAAEVAVEEEEELQEAHQEAHQEAVVSVVVNHHGKNESYF